MDQSDEQGGAAPGDEAARLEDALERIAAAAKPQAAQPALGREMAARLDQVIADLRAALA